MIPVAKQAFVIAEINAVLLAHRLSGLLGTGLSLIHDLEFAVIPLVRSNVKKSANVAISRVPDQTGKRKLVPQSQNYVFEFHNCHPVTVVSLPPANSLYSVNLASIRAIVFLTP